MMTKAELEASVSVLRALKTDVCATVVLTWPEADARAYVRLYIAGYVGHLDQDGRLRIAPMRAFRWDRIRATGGGLRWLAQIEAQL